jgi:hypothetical protein
VTVVESIALVSVTGGDVDPPLEQAASQERSRNTRQTKPIKMTSPFSPDPSCTIDAQGAEPAAQEEEKDDIGRHGVSPQDILS